MTNRKVAVVALAIAAVVLVAGCIYLVFSSLTGQQAGTSTSRPTPIPASTPATTPASNGGGTTTAGAKGIFQFSSHNAATNADNPSLQGTNLNYYWSKLEPQQGQYNWDAIDKDMKPWVDNHKRVILRVATSGWSQWDPDLGSGHATPQWVYDSGVQSVTEVDHSVHPQYWNPKFLAAYQGFIQAMAQHYDNNPNVAAIQMGIGDGGETKVDTRRNNDNLIQQWQDIGYTDPVWWDTMQKIVDMYTSNFHHVPLAILPDSSFIGKTRGYGESMVISYAINHKLWLQDDGLVTNRQLDPSWMNVPHIEEQRQETKRSGDTLQDDLTAAINVKATYILVFASDINQPANAQVLQNAAKQLAQQ